jgi:hypothetical protein
MTCLAKLAVKESQHCRAPAILTHLVLVSEAVDPTSMTWCPPLHRGREHNQTSVGSTPCSSTQLSSHLPPQGTVRTLSRARRLELQKCEPLAHQAHTQGRPLPELTNPLTCMALSVPSHESSDLASSNSPIA